MKKLLLALFVLISAVAAVPALVIAQACSGGACQQSVARSSERVSSSGGTSVDSYTTTTITNASVPGDNTQTTIATMTVPVGTYVIHFTGTFAAAGESGDIRMDRCRILVDGSVANSQQTIRIQNFGGLLAMTAVATTTTGVIAISVREGSIVGTTVNAVNLNATKVSSVTVL